MNLIAPTDNLLDAPSRVVLTEGLRRHAVITHAPYPQYSGQFDTWELYVVTHDVEFHTCDMPAGRIVLADPNLRIHEGTPVTRRAYCPDTGHIVGMPHEHINALPKED